MNKISTIISIFILGFMLNSCNNDDTNEGYPYAIRMTDAPALYDAVFVDIKDIEIIGDGKRVYLNVNKGIYNLLDLSNGKSTLIAIDTLDIAVVEQIRLILGPNNSVLIKNTKYPLSTPIDQQSGLKLQVNQKLQQGLLNNVLLDFDANKSIVTTGNGEFILKPVIRTIEPKISGVIKGKISPLGTQSIIEVKVNGNSYSTIVNAQGNFLIMGLPEGSYEVSFTPRMDFKQTILNNIIVTKGKTTDIGTTSL
ncbi:DUF4382 domain-containing protein [Flavobacterium sp. K5-23]|uniref:DUF4382 domain-containing protein n=1 Tax=Flavobacterium sp. K5-23 TaxID=2746225 RepID=UPI00200FF5A5|nr:DUF4382 domain-containing protein [Flavobacterium sp. K5-23]UQD57161.1 DUF4382 domain-containing protein [Flavobacterium sp. K5-23]